MTTKISSAILRSSPCLCCSGNNFWRFRRIWVITFSISYRLVSCANISSLQFLRTKTVPEMDQPFFSFVVIFQRNNFADPLSSKFHSLHKGPTPCSNYFESRTSCHGICYSESGLDVRNNRSDQVLRDSVACGHSLVCVTLLSRHTSQIFNFRSVIMITYLHHTDPVNFILHPPFIRNFEISDYPSFSGKRVEFSTRCRCHS